MSFSKKENNFLVCKSTLEMVFDKTFFIKLFFLICIITYIFQ